MMYQELRQGDIPCLSSMKNTNYVMYVGPELTQKELEKLHSLDIGVPVIYLPEVVQGISKEAFEYNFPGISWPGEISADLIYNQIKSELGEHLITPESRLLLKFDGEVLVIFDAKGSFDLAISYIINKLCLQMMAELILPIGFAIMVRTISLFFGQDILCYKEKMERMYSVPLMKILLRK